MLKNNNLITGLLGGAILPGVSLFVFLYLLKGDFLILNKPGLPYLIAIVINMFIIRYCFKVDKANIATGMILVTFVFTALVFLLKLIPIR
jgi:hypothetical protein